MAPFRGSLQPRGHRNPRLRFRARNAERDVVLAHDRARLAAAVAAAAALALSCGPPSATLAAAAGTLDGTSSTDTRYLASTRNRHPAPPPPPQLQPPGRIATPTGGPPATDLDADSDLPRSIPAPLPDDELVVPAPFQDSPDASPSLPPVPRTPSEPPFQIPEPSSPFPAEPMPMPPVEPPQFLVQRTLATAATDGIHSSSWPAATHSNPRVLSDAEPAASPLPSDVDFPDIVLPAPVQYDVTLLSNGLRVFLLEDHEAPLVQGQLIFPGGAVTSPADKVGLASIATSLQRAGGSTKFPELLLNAMLDDMASALESKCLGEASFMSFKCVSGETPVVLDALLSLLREPQLPAAKLSLIQAQRINSISHQNDSKAAVAKRRSQEILFGPDSLYARRPTVATVQAIGVDDCAQWLHEWQRPDTARLVLTGDFDAVEMLQVAEASLGQWRSWPGSPAVPSEVPSGPGPQAGSGGVVHLVHVPGLRQAAVAVAEPGVRLADDAACALDMLGSTMNGFGGLLFDAVRSKSGLAYNVSAGWELPVTHEGLFFASAETARPAELISQMQTVFRGISDGPVPDGLVKQKQDERLNSFVFQVASRAEVASRMALFDVQGLPGDFLYKYNEQLQAVQAEEVVKAAREHLHADKQLIVVVADGTRVREQLAALGRPVVEEQLDSV